jgi:DMSO/TMAO reductase YedYZ molybdopterin-dependent catalytic subunit
MTSCAEWTGVPLSLLLKEAGVQNRASWIVAEGAEEVKARRAFRSRRPWTTVWCATA